MSSNQAVTAVLSAENACTYRDRLHPSHGVPFMTVYLVVYALLIINPQGTEGYCSCLIQNWVGGEANCLEQASYSVVPLCSSG